MNAARLLIECADAGIHIRVEGDGLKLTAAAEPSPAVLARLTAAKPEIISYLTEQEQLVHMIGQCEECGQLDDGTLSVVLLIERDHRIWVHAPCYTVWTNQTEVENLDKSEIQL